jgi:hypothetical protein
MRASPPSFERLRPFAWLALALVAAGYGWNFVDEFRWWGAPLWPNENTVIFNWVVFVLLELMAPLPLLGFWLMAHAYWRGGGRLYWRWWLGGFFALDFLWGTGEFLYSALWPKERALYIGAHPGLGSILALLAVIPLWIVIAPRIRGAEGGPVELKAS